MPRPSPTWNANSTNLAWLDPTRYAPPRSLDRSSHGTCKLVSDKLWSTKIGIPPLAEQHRIVAKVTELLALCDQLKTRIAATRAKHAQLAQTLVEAAVA